MKTLEKTVYKSVLLKNNILKIDPTLVVELKNVKVNGAPFGCTGFITNPQNEKIVYVSTDHNHGLRMNNALYRTAQHTKDYTGGHNNFSSYDDLAQNIVKLIKK